MARRIINKAYGDLVGAGNEVAVSRGPEVHQSPSVLKSSAKYVRYDNKRAGGKGPMDDRQVSKVSLDSAHPVEDAQPEEVGRKLHFVNIDGDNSAVPREGEKISATAYKMKSFMSTLDVGMGRQPQMPSPAKQVPDSSKAIHQDTVKKSTMFLPKGINQTNQPYVVPKFMPSYREMMKPKHKIDPLVSIVETTPPSMQKWAIEWNNEPKKTISIEELKEDLIREEAEKSHNVHRRIQMGHSKREYSPDDGNSVQLDVKNQPRHAEPKKIQSSVIEHESPWKQVHVPVSVEAPIAARHLGNSAPKVNKIGQPLVDWVPPKYSSVDRKSTYPPSKEYSFQEAINSGAPVKKGAKEPTIVEPKLPFLSATKHDAYLDTEHKKFHEWFREKVSSAVQTAVNQPKNTMNDPNGHQLNKEQTNVQAVAVHQNDGCKDSVKIDIEKQNNPILNNFSATESEVSSSFYQWLKMREHHVTKNDRDPPAEKVGTDKKPKNGSLFPWSVSYSVRRRMSIPKVTSKVLLPLSENSKKSSRTAHRDKVTSRHVKSYFKQSVHSLDEPIIKDKMYPKTFDSAKGRKKFDRDDLVKSSSKKMSLQHKTMAATQWSSEMDHVNYVRKSDILGDGSGGPLMNYWESKYIKKPGSPQNRRISQSKAKAPPYSWFRPRVMTKPAGERVGNGGKFSSIGDNVEFPLKLTQNADQALEGFDAMCLYDEEVEDKDLAKTETLRNENANDQENAQNERAIQKVKDTERIKSPTTTYVCLEDSNQSLEQRTQPKLEEDEFVLALGEDPGTLDLEWSKFINLKDNFDNNSDLTALIGSQARQLGSVKDNCL